MNFPSARIPTRARRGFSLIELLMVVAIMAILALFALPRVRVEQAHVDAAIRTLSMSMMVAQREAVSRGHNVLLVIDTTAHVLRTVWDANNNFQIDGGEKTRPFPIPERVVMGRGYGCPAYNGATAAVPTLRSVASMPAIVLQRSGSADRSTVIYLTTKKARDYAGENIECRAMSIERATGRPNWFKFVGGSWKRGS